MNIIKRVQVAVPMLGLVAALSACSGGSGSNASSPQSTLTSTVTVTKAAPPTVSVSPNSSSTSGKSPASSKTSPQTSSTTANGRCSAPTLAAKVLKIGVGGGSALYTVGLRNTGSSGCTLLGFPGVSMVAGSSGTQIGAPAERAIESRSVQVKLRPGDSATFELSVAQAANYPVKTCEPTAVRGFRIYPPGSKEALFLPGSGLVSCAVKSTKVLTVGPVR